MSVVGIDIGNENCFLAVARAGGLEIIVNEYSQRVTPTYVAFGERNRDIGVSAKNKHITNLRNTIFSFKRLIGKTFRDPLIQQEISYLPYDLCELPSGNIGIKVNYFKEETVFTVQQVMAMMLTKLKEIGEIALRNKITQCVISVPVYFTDSERRALLDAAKIAGLNVRKLMNETSAVSLCYGFYKQDLLEDKPEKVIFVDMGNSSLQIAVCEFTKGKGKILASVWDRNLGGRDFDNVLVKYFTEDFKTRYKLDVASNRRALMRLVQECERLKKQMSANPHELPLNIECLMDDKDVSGRIKREVFENLCADLLARVEMTMRMALTESKVNAKNVNSVQIVGGSMRIPALKQLVEKVYGCKPCTTLNQDEAVARGCTLQCAMLSPAYKVRDFLITDVQPFPIKMAWDSNKTVKREMELFTQYHQVPFSKVLTFYRSEPLSLEASYAESTNIPYPRNHIGTFNIEKINKNPAGEDSELKVQVDINLNGIFNVCSANLIEKQTSELTIENGEEQFTNGQQRGVQKKKNLQNKNNETINKDGITDQMQNGRNLPDVCQVNHQENGNIKGIDEKWPKYAVKSIELPIEAKVPHLSAAEVNNFIENEIKMMMHDRLEKEKDDAKNALEEYVYEMRGKLHNELEKFISEQDRKMFMHRLEDTENWLYGEGEDQPKNLYVEKLMELKKLGDPVIDRMVEFNQRSTFVKKFSNALNLFRKALDLFAAKDEQYSHIKPEEMDKMFEKTAQPVLVKPKLKPEVFVEQNAAGDGEINSSEKNTSQDVSSEKCEQASRTNKKQSQQEQMETN